MFSTEVYSQFAAHHGVLSRSELLDLGLSLSQIKRRAASGVLARVYPGVFRLSGIPQFWMGEARALALSVDGLISHGSAAYVWGFDERLPNVVDVTVEYERAVPRQGARVHRSTQYELGDPEVVEAVPVTGAARTILDCAAKYSSTELGHLVDAALRSKIIDWPDLYDVQIRHSAKGRDGTGRLRNFLDSRYGDRRVPDTRWNRMVGELLADAGVGQPDYEHEIRTANGNFIARVDLAYPAAKLAIELDSVRYHLNHESFVNDPRRKNAIQLEGWTVLSFTWPDYADRPFELIRTVRTQLTNLKD